MKNKEVLIKALLENSALDLYKDILNDFPIHDIFQISNQEEKHRLAFRATWLLEHLFIQKVVRLEDYSKEVIALYLSTNNESSLRSISKLIMNILKKHIDLLKDSDQEQILEKTFHILENVTCPIALLVNAWDILYLLSANHEWLQKELKMQIQFQLEKKATPATVSRGKKILQKLK